MTALIKALSILGPGLSLLCQYVEGNIIMELIFIPRMPQQIQCVITNFPRVHEVKRLIKIIKIKLQIKIKTSSLLSGHYDDRLFKILNMTTV